MRCNVEKKPDPFRWLSYRVKIAEHQLLAEDARARARYDPEELEIAEYHEDRAEALEAELLFLGHGHPRYKN